MNFSSMCNDIVTLVKSNGNVIEKIKANVQPNMIFIYDEKLPLEENDKLYRQLPNGLVETYLVIDRGYFSAFQGIQGHYQAKVKKEVNINKEKLQSIINIYNATGPNSRINISSVDQSQNIYKDSEELFNRIKDTIKTITDEKVKKESLSLLNELKNSQGSPNFLMYYQNFISTIADYMSIMGPFIPALTKLIE